MSDTPKEVASSEDYVGIVLSRLNCALFAMFIHGSMLHQPEGRVNYFTGTNIVD